MILRPGKTHIFLTVAEKEENAAKSCHAEEGRSPDVGISCSAPKNCIMLINIENLKYTM